jgi:hypothetical protein
LNKWNHDVPEHCLHTHNSSLIKLSLLGANWAPINNAILALNDMPSLIFLLVNITINFSPSVNCTRYNSNRNYAGSSNSNNYLAPCDTRDIKQLLLLLLLKTYFFFLNKKT